MIYGLEVPSSIYFDYLNIIVENFGVVGSRYFFIFTTAVSVSAFSLICYLVSRSVLVAFAPVFAIALPASLTQFIFINGSHPTTALPVVAGFYLFCIATLKVETRLGMVVAATGAAGAAIIAREMTSLGLAISLSALPFLLIAFQSALNRKLKVAVFLLIAAASPLAFVFESLFVPDQQSHYLDLAGWVNVEAEFILERVATMLGGLFSSSEFILSLGILSIAVALMFGFTATQRPRGLELRSLRLEECVVGAALIAGGALTFAPALVVLEEADRYLELATFLTGTGLFYLVFALMRTPSDRNSIAITVILGILVIFGMGLTVRGAVADRYANLQKASSEIYREINAQRERMPENSQIVITGDNQIPFPGYNHWSTGLVRYFTDRLDLIALIGPSSAISEESPFVGQWQAHGPDQWTTDAEGIARRKRMVGLELGRATFGYRYDLESNSLEPVGVLAEDGGVLRYAAFGELFEPVRGADDLMAAFCAGSEASTAEMDDDTRASSAPIQFGSGRGAMEVPQVPVDGNAVELDGETEEPLTISMPAGEELVAEFWFDPDDTDFARTDFSDTYPPTPVLAPGLLQLWQLEGERWVAAGSDMSIGSSAQTAYFQVYRVPGCATYVQLNSSYKIVPSSNEAELMLQIGRGHGNRTWDGEVIYRVRAKQPSGEGGTYAG